MPPLSGGDFKRNGTVDRGGGRTWHPGIRILSSKRGQPTASRGARIIFANRGGASASNAAELARGSACDRCNRSGNRNILRLRDASRCSFTCDHRCPGSADAGRKEGSGSDSLQLSDGCQSIFGGPGRTAHQTGKPKSSAGPALYSLAPSTCEF